MSKIKLTVSGLKRAKAEVLSYIQNRFSACYFDCSDSVHEADSHEDRFDGIVNDSIPIKDFIEQHFLKEYAEAWQEYIDEYDWTDEEKQNPTVRGLPIPYEKFKHLIERSVSPEDTKKRASAFIRKHDGLFKNLAKGD